MDDKAIVRFVDEKRGIDVDLEVPLDITANEFVTALNTTYDLGIDTDNMKECFLKSEAPIVLIKGSRSLRDFGIRTGSIIRY